MEFARRIVKFLSGLHGCDLYESKWVIGIRGIKSDIHRLPVVKSLSTFVQVTLANILVKR